VYGIQCTVYGMIGERERQVLDNGIVLCVEGGIENGVTKEANR
jgi:hypothetical protein